jgi:hypothetical protein
MFGISITKNGLGFDHSPQKKYEEKVKRMELKNSQPIKETLKEIQRLESEGKIEEAKKLRKNIQKING